MRLSRVRTVSLVLAGTCFAAATVPAQVVDTPARRKPGGLKPGVVQQPRPVLQAAEPASGATIKRFGVAGPVTGGQGSFGLLELNAPAPAGGMTIQLSSDNPAIKIPPTISVAAGADGQSFLVTTGPVASSTTATVSAKTGAAAAPQTATIAILPPSLSFVSCTPQTVPAGSPTSCKVQLNGVVATPSLGAERDKRVSQLRRTAMSAGRLALTIDLASSNQAVATVPATVRIGAGQQSTNFAVTTKPLAQSASSLISASYGGATKGTNVHVQPVSLEYVACGNSPASTSTECAHIPQYTNADGYSWGGILGNVRLTAPAPAGGLVVKLSDSPNLVRFSSGQVDSIRVPQGQRDLQFKIRPRAVVVDTRVTVSASASVTGETRTLVVTVKAPSVNVLEFPWVGDTISGVPIGGRSVGMRVRLNGSAPNGGWPVDLKHSGTTDITGPARVTIPERGSAYDHTEFNVTVGPCSANPVCEVVVSTGSLSARLIVKP